MGGNGSYSYFVANTLGTYTKDRYKTIGMIGKTKVVSVTKGERDKTPMNSFSSSMYYVTKPQHPERITTIAFYDKRAHGIKRSIDLIYDEDGNLKPYVTYLRKGREKVDGTHSHRWKKGEDGDYGRTSHDGSNTFEPTKTDWIYIKRAIRYNEKQQSNGK